MSERGPTPGPGDAAPDIFISYAREDHDTAQQLARALAGESWSVWWDREIRGGSDFTEAIASNLAGARLVLVLWSEHAVRSSFVRDESARARDMGKLLPLRIEEVELPLGFGQIHTLDLIDWDGDAGAAEFRALVHEIRQAFGQRTGLRPDLPTRRFPLKLKKLAWVVLVVAVLGGGIWGYQWRQEASAQRFFQEGLKAQFDREPNLESARNNYLSALEYRPRFARARYYLGHVYAQLQLREDARASFERAIAIGRGLDEGQFRDARRLLAVLTVAAEPEPVSRSMEKADAGASTAAKESQVRPSESVTAAAAEPPKPAPTPGSVATATASVRPVRPLSPTVAGIDLPGVRVERLGGLPHVPPDPDQARRVKGLVDQMFASAAEARISATTSLVVEPVLVSDAVPLAVDEALRVQSAPPGDRAGLAAARSGVINTLVLLRAASPVALRKHAGDIERLIGLARPNGPQTAALADEVAGRLKDAVSRRPVTWIQIADEVQRPLAQRIRQRLIRAGYDAPAIENVGSARSPSGRSEIRTQGTSDQALARWQALVLESMGLADPKQTVLRKASPKVDGYEIWLDRESCVSRPLPVCG